MPAKSLTRGLALCLLLLCPLFAQAQRAALDVPTDRLIVKWRKGTAGHAQILAAPDRRISRANLEPLYMYLMNGATVRAEGFLKQVADPNWKIAAVGDYDGDGKSDLLWRNSATGENYLYPMDGTTIKPSEGFLRTVPVGSWTVVGR